MSIVSARSTRPSRWTAARVSVVWRNFDLQLNVYNLFDKDYVSAINKSGYRYTPSTPRSAMLTANVRF